MIISQETARKTLHTMDSLIVIVAIFRTSENSHPPELYAPWDCPQMIRFTLEQQDRMHTILVQSSTMIVDIKAYVSCSTVVLRHFCPSE